MVWGKSASSGVEDLVARLKRSDPTLASLTILRFRRFGPPEVEALCAALHTNATLTELNASGHAMGEEEAAKVGDMLAVNSALLSICVGDSSFGELRRIPPCDILHVIIRFNR